MNAVLTSIDSHLQNQVCHLVCEAIVKIQAQHPELLQEKYRGIPWSSSRYQDGLVTKLTGVLDSSADWQVLLQRVQKFLSALLLADAFKLSEVADLKSQIYGLKDSPAVPSENIDNQAVNQTQVAKEESNPVVSDNKAIAQSQTNNFALLLLDIESLQLNSETEGFLQSICHLPIQTKIALGDWSQQKHLDLEFYRRGYDLIHIPTDKSQTGVMNIATFASLIPQKFPQATSVLICTQISVCNFENTIDHVFRDLEQAGLTIYHVTQENHQIFAIDRQKQQTHTHNIIPEFDQLNTAIAQIISDEAKATENQWMSVSKIAEIFAAKYQISLDTVIKYHVPDGDQSFSDILKHQSDFVTYQPADTSELYITQFKLPNLSPLSSDITSNENSDIKDRE